MFKFWLPCLLMLCVIACQHKEIEPLTNLVNFDDEDIIGIPNANIINLNTKSNEVSFDGKHASKVSTESPYGIGFTMDSVSAGDQLEVSVMVKGQGKSGIVISVDTSWYSKHLPLTQSDGWQEIKFNVLLKGTIDKQQLKIYSFIGEDKLAYFDCFKVRYLPRDLNIKRNVKVKNHYSLELDSVVYAQLKQFRIKGFQKGILTKKEKKWVNGILNGEKIKLRLKGDWTDHIVGDKWSFRVKTKQQEFSIQKPEARNFECEWLFKQALHQEGILTTNYEFISLDLNGLNKGVMVKESHFDKAFLKSKNLNGGAILKIDESLLWKLRVSADRYNMYQRENEIPIELISPLKPFFKSEFNDLAIALLDSLRHGVIDLESAIDMAHFAKYFALCHVFKADHGTMWHNIRFFYHPEKRKLEPIGYDNFESESLKHSQLLIDSKDLPYMVPPNAILFQDAKFRKLYYQYLSEYSNENYIQNLLNKHRKELDEIKFLLNQEYPDREVAFDYLLKTFNFYSAEKIENAKNSWLIEDTILYSQEKKERFKTAKINADFFRIENQEQGSMLYNYSSKDVEIKVKGKRTMLPAFNHHGIPKGIPFEEKIKRKQIVIISK